MTRAKIGVIGGSGVYQMDGLTGVEEISVKTPFGDPSDAIVVGTLEGQKVAFLPRHGRGHRILPSDVPSRANIFALKSLGVERIISLSACGSLKQEMAPLDIVIPDQVFDRTKARPSTFFGGGLVVHISFAEPFCPHLSSVLYDASVASGAHVHRGGTLVVMEGPAFSTKAESRIYRQWGCDIIGMTALPEAKLAREAEMCYATVACVTDYDVWHPDHDSVTVEMVVKTLLQNAETSKHIVRQAVKHVGDKRACSCGSALKDAIITARDRIPEQTKRDLAPLIGKYLS
jgi:5'-methylthioadenosine phosphorylase